MDTFLVIIYAPSFKFVGMRFALVHLSVHPKMFVTVVEKWGHWYAIDMSLFYYFVYYFGDNIIMYNLFTVPGYISRSVAGSYDNEGIAIFALMFTYFLWVRIYSFI